MKRSERPISVSNKPRKSLFEFDDTDEPIPPPIKTQYNLVPIKPDEKMLPLLVMCIITINGIVWFAMLLFSADEKTVGYAFASLMCIPMVIILMVIQWILVYLHYKFFWWVWMVYGLIFTIITLFMIGILLTGGELPI